MIVFSWNILPLPIEVRIHDHALRHERRAVALIEGGVVPRLHRVPENRWIPLELSEMRDSVGVQQQLVGIEAMPALRLIGPMDAITVNCAGPNIREISVPDLIGVLG
jgi:hypothetical protein